MRAAIHKEIEADVAWTTCEKHKHALSIVSGLSVAAHLTHACSCLLGNTTASCSMQMLVGGDCNKDMGGLLLEGLLVLSTGRHALRAYAAQDDCSGSCGTCCTSVPSQDNLSRNWSQVSVNDSYMISVAVHDDDVVALKTNMSEQKPVQVIRYVHGRHADKYVYCGLYEVCHYFALSLHLVVASHLRLQCCPQ